jgi:hypothetical protein
VSTSQSEPPPPSAAHTVPISGAHNPDQRRLKVNTDRDHAASGQAYLAHLPSRAGVSDRPIQGPPENCAGSIPPWLAPATVPQCYVRFVSVMRLSVVGIAVAANRRPRARRCVTRPSPPVSRRRWSEQAIARTPLVRTDRATFEALRPTRKVMVYLFPRLTNVASRDGSVRRVCAHGYLGRRWAGSH